MQLTDCTCHTAARVERLGGDRAFRRRLMELGLLPGTPLTVVGRAPFGGPLELLFRGCRPSPR
jgi:ferrous iron transport protein A